MATLLGTRANRSNWRWLLAPAALIAAVAHVPEIGPHLVEAPYMGGLFIAFAAACMVLASAVLVRDVPATYGVAILTCGLAIIGYAATRVVAFPQLADDVGNWLEPLGVVSVAAEGVVVLAAIGGLRVTKAGRPPVVTRRDARRSVGEQWARRRR